MTEFLKFVSSFGKIRRHIYPQLPLKHIFFEASHTTIKFKVLPFSLTKKIAQAKWSSLGILRLY